MAEPGGSSADFQQLVERAADLILISRDGVVIYANPAARTALGRGRLEGVRALDLAHPGDQALIGARIRAARDKGAENPPLEFRLLHQDGSVLVVEGVSFPLNFQGEPAVAMMGRDITVRRRAEEERARLQADFRGLVDAMPGAVVIHERGRVVYANPEAVRVLRYPSVASFLGHDVAETTPPERTQEERQRLGARIEGRLSVVREEQLLRRADGTTGLFEVSAVPMTLEGRDLRVVVFHDVTERHEIAERLRLVIESSPLPILSFSAQLELVGWNEAARRELGYPAQGSGEKPEIFPENLERIAELCRRSEGPGIAILEGSMVRFKDRQPRQGRLLASPLRGHDGKPFGYVVIVEDQTELRVANQLLRAVFEASPLAIVGEDLAGQVQLWNTAAERIFGFAAAEVLGRALPTVPPERASEYRELVEGAARGRRFADFETLRRRKDGTFVEVSIFGGPLRDARGATIGSVALLADATERKRNEAQRAALQSAVLLADQDYRLTFDAVDAAVMLVDAQGRIARSNARAQALIAAAREEPGAPLEQLGLPEEPPGGLWTAAARLFAEVKATRGATSIQIRHGPRSWNLFAVHSPSTERSEERVLLVVRDVTAMTELQESLRRSETLSAMGSLVAGVAHEVRNPLFGMSATLDALERRFDAPDLRPFTDRLRGELDRLNHLMTELLEYGKPPTASLQKRPFGAVLARALLACAPLAAKAQVRVIGDLPEAAGRALPEALPDVLLDESRMAQVLQNLIENAVQHSPAGGEVRVEVQATRARGRPELECAVLDRGPGFRSEDLAHVLEPFFTRRRGGTGLGLSIVQRIVEQHGGAVVPANREGGGAAVRVLLPIVSGG